MAKTRSMSRNQNHDDDAGDGDGNASSSSNMKRLKTSCPPWSDLDHNVLFLIMMQLGVVDFVTFSGVCKSWRSLALSDWNTFMASKPPMTIHVSRRGNKRPCFLEDFEGRKFKTIIPGFTGGVCVGLTSGYLIFFRERTRDFWLVNPITRRKLHFPGYPGFINPFKGSLKGVLVFSPSISEWVFAVFYRYTNSDKIWFYIMGKGTWNRVNSLEVVDIHAFKGKIYTLIADTQCPLSQLILNPEPKLMLMETKNFPHPHFFYGITSSGENIYGMVFLSKEDEQMILEFDFGEMKWVSCEKTMGEYALFVSDKNASVAVKPESWADPESQYWRYVYGIYCSCLSDHHGYELSGESKSFHAKMWYFPHECLR